MNRSLDSVKKNIGAMRAEAEGLALGLAIREAAQFVKRNLDMAGALGETAQQLGVTTRELQVYRAIGGQVGVTTEEMDSGLQKLTMSIGKASVGAKAQNEAFTALGVSIRDSSGQIKSTGTVLAEMADKIAKIPDPAQRAAVEVAIFGRAGQKLDTILTGGAKGIEDYAKTAEDMGMILSDDLVQAADNASDKIAQLNAQLTANIAGAVAQNAGAILGLAGALQSATIGAVKFINQYPRLSAALAGAALGARFGPWGAGIGAAAGYVTGNRMAQGQDDANPDVRFRAQKLREATARANRFIAARDKATPAQRAELVNSYDYKAAKAELNRQRGLLGQSLAPALPVLPPVGTDLPNFLAGGGGGGGRKTRTPKAPKSPLDPDAFANDLARLNMDILRAKEDNLTDLSKLKDIQHDQLELETSQLYVDIDRNVKEGKFTQAQGDQLYELVAQLDLQKSMTINMEEALRNTRENLETKIAANDNERDLLQAQEAIAVTTDERKGLQLRILDLDKEAERLKLQETINLAKIGEATAGEAKRAQERLNRLDEIYDARATSVRQQNRSPLEQYIAENDPAKLGERVEGLMVQQLEYVQRGLSDAVSNALGVEDPFLRGLIDLFIQTNFIQPLAEALQANMKGGSGGGGLLGAIFGGIGAAFGGGGGLNVGAAISGGQAALNSIPIMGAFASGTMNAPRGFALVGEKGPEIVKFRGGEQVFNRAQLSGMAANNNGHTFNITVGPGGSDRERRESAQQHALAIRRVMNGPLR